MVIHLDSSFLIDLLQETRRERPGGAFNYIEQLSDGDVLCASVHVICELRVGPELHRRPIEEHEVLDRMLSGMVVVYPDARFPPVYGRLLAAITRTGRPVGSCDLLIATAAIIDDAPIVTRNVKDFSRVPGLRVLEY